MATNAIFSQLQRGSWAGRWAARTHNKVHNGFTLHLDFVALSPCLVVMYYHEHSPLRRRQARLACRTGPRYWAWLSCPQAPERPGHQKRRGWWPWRRPLKIYFSLFQTNQCFCGKPCISASLVLPRREAAVEASHQCSRPTKRRTRC